LEQVSFTSNSTLKKATVTIPKKVIEPTKEEAAPTEKPKKTVRKKAAKKAAKEETPSQSEETMTHISSKLAQKLSQNGSKYAKMLKRGADGRFVRRTPKGE
jgi:hypothetical protein